MTNLNRRNIIPILMIVIGLLLLVSSFLLLIDSSPFIKLIPASKAQSDSVYHIYPEIRRISVDDAKVFFDQKEVIFLDTRGEPLFSKGHIPGALSITVDQLFEKIDELDRNYLLITYCDSASEETSARLARLLLDNGFSMVMPLQGGIDAWVKFGFPLE